MSENVRGQVIDSVFRTLLVLDLLILKRPMEFERYSLESQRLVQRNVKLWRSARRQIFKEYNDKKKEQRRAKKRT